MCGIVGYAGSGDVARMLMGGLRRLEYRGYDSAGIAVLDGGELTTVRELGNLDKLQKKLAGRSLPGTVGIGHTRWATHGKPSEENAHPHADCVGDIAVVHNGIIENFSQLRRELEARGHRLSSETDSEVLAHLIEEEATDGLLGAVRSAVAKVHGSYALVAISKRHPGLLVAARKDSPMVIGLGKDENFIASDIPALLDHTRKAMLVENGEFVELTANACRIFDEHGQQVQRGILQVTWDAAAAERGGYEDFMLKEIYEQPTAIRETLRGQLAGDGRLELPELKLTDDDLRAVEKVFIIACGTSLHAGLVARQQIETWASLAVEIESSSEFRYRKAIVDKKTLVIAITQSGETADTLAGVRLAKSKGAKIVAVTNVIGSSVTREADGVVLTHAGPEIGVAATKTLVSQFVALTALALRLALARGGMKPAAVADVIAELELMPDRAEVVLSRAGELSRIANEYWEVFDFLFLGRGSGYPVAMEGALKLKEISYIHAEGYPAGEMKHGPIALISDIVPVVAVVLQGPLYEKMMSNLQEAKARGGRIIAVATDGDNDVRDYAEEVIYVPACPDLLSPILAVIPLQLLAYYIAKKRGCNVDQPRNLAKSVTVE